MSLEDRWAAQLAALQRQHRYRTLGLPRGLDFASNDYLGYGQRLRGSAGERRSGQASRLLRGHAAAWDEVETTLAAWHGAEAALVFTSGYAANEGLLSTVIEREDWVASDALNHASLIDGLRLSRAERVIFRHNDLDHLETLLRAAPTRPGCQRFIVTESLFGMDGDLAPLQELVPLAERYGAAVIVDEAHATGCFHSNGSGLVDAAGLRSRVLATIHTGGKALGVAGGYVCGSRRLRDILINRCRHFIFTTALPEAIAHWWLDMLAELPGDRDRRETLHARAACFRQDLRQRGIPLLGSTYIVPVLLGDDCRALHVAQQLQTHGFDVRAIRPPSVPVGSARLRISIHADHERAVIQALAMTLGDVLADVA